MKDSLTVAAVLAVMGLVVPVSAHAQAAKPAAPSFDCAKAVGQVQQLVCKDAALAALDRKLAGAFAKAMKAWPPDIAAEQRAIQRGWIKGRDDCWKSSDVRTCVDLEYKTRIVQLQIKSGQLMAPTPVEFACNGTENKPVTASFYKDTDPQSVVLTVGDDQVVAFIAPAASGARYAAQGVEFWEHQGTASISWFDTKLSCTPAAPSRFQRTLALQGVSFTVTCDNDSSFNQLSIVPAGLSIDNQAITQSVDGQVVGAEVADLDANGSPELYVYVRSVGSGSYGSLAAYAANNRKSLSAIVLPAVVENQTLAKGYMGHDEFAVVENRLVQRFPIYLDSDTNARPTGGTRQIQYKLVPGEAGWLLAVDRVDEY